VRTPVILPVDREARTETTPNPEGFCLPTPGPPPVLRAEKIVGRNAGR